MMDLRWLNVSDQSRWNLSLFLMVVLIRRSRQSRALSSSSSLFAMPLGVSPADQMRAETRQPRDSASRNLLSVKISSMWHDSMYVAILFSASSISGLLTSSLGLPESNDRKFDTLCRMVVCRLEFLLKLLLLECRSVFRTSSMSVTFSGSRWSLCSLRIQSTTLRHPLLTQSPYWFTMQNMVTRASMALLSSMKASDSFAFGFSVVINLHREMTRLSMASQKCRTDARWATERNPSIVYWTMDSSSA
mmetsp:Transcript_11716/g.35624  ORF Transcript_11716/g.35624 Transcript_11716/m.35624 type:complete len:247 (-) Transcript_11716:2522-3262(-)